MLEEKNFANMNLNSAEAVERRHRLKSNVNKKNQFPKMVTINSNLQQSNQTIPNQTAAQTASVNVSGIIPCDYCGKRHCGGLKNML